MKQGSLGGYGVEDMGLCESQFDGKRLKRCLGQIKQANSSQNGERDIACLFIQMR